MISARALTKRYGSVTAVEELTFDVEPGTVTGFLGPNGAGKSTTMRMILALDTPTSGSVTVAGHAYRDLPSPSRVVGALLDPAAVHPRLRARTHLLAVARATAVSSARVDEALRVTGIAHAADRLVSALSLGMRQRLGLAVALLGDPEVLVLDEPLNGLDPEGIVWMRSLLQDRAARGRTVLVSSHLMNEMQETADHVVVIGKGRLIAQMSVAELTARAAESVRVVCDDPVALTRLAEAEGATVAVEGPALVVRGLDAGRVGEIALTHRLLVRELTPERAGLEAAFITLTAAHPPTPTSPQERP